MDFLVDEGWSWNNTNAASQSVNGNVGPMDGTANFPNGEPGDTGFQLNDAWVFFYREMKTNLLPRITPLPGPMPKKFDWGFMAEYDYGRDGQPCRMNGIDAYWGPNEPGASNPNWAAGTKANLMCAPELYTQFYIPAFKGIAITAGRYGDGLGFEIPPNLTLGPNFFYSHDYAFYMEASQVLGILGSVNVMRSPKNGWMMVEFGLNQGGSQVAQPANGGQLNHFESAVRWRSPHMSTWVDYSFRMGAGNVQTNVLTGLPTNSITPAGQSPFGANYPIYSPNNQLRQMHDAFITHRYKKWEFVLNAQYAKQSGDGAANTIYSFPVLAPPFAHPGFTGAKASGFNGRVTYELNKKLAAGFRYENFHDSQGFFLLPLDVYGTAAVPGNPATIGPFGLSKGAYNDATLGMVYKP